MKNLIVILWLLIFSVLINAQQEKSKDHSKLNINCKTCHTCDVPTKSEPCLVMCPREKVVTVYQKPEQTPELIIIDQLSNRYSPVYFSHRIHAQMSEMSGGCKGCHHYNTSGPILKCSNCHDVSRKREDVSVPDLNGAYHRQCVDCHREWSRTTDCNSCHTLKKEMRSDEKLALQKKFSNKNHPEVLEPTKLVYQTKSEKGKLVTFYHNDHTSKFGIDCVSCHKQESCIKCHDVNKPTDDKTKTVKTKVNFEEQHQNCISCHPKTEKCNSCHSDKSLEPFDHSKNTGWVLKSYHSQLTCNKCHGSQIPYKKLNNQCTNCHVGWNNETFKHLVTGLELDETHVEFDCGDCHEGEDFSKKPSCEGCHDDKTFPESKPGKLVK